MTGEWPPCDWQVVTSCQWVAASQAVCYTSCRTTLCRL